MIWDRPFSAATGSAGYVRRRRSRQHTPQDLQPHPELQEVEEQQLEQEQGAIMMVKVGVSRYWDGWARNR